MTAAPIVDEMLVGFLTLKNPTEWRLLESFVRLKLNESEEKNDLMGFLGLYVYPGKEEGDDLAYGIYAKRVADYQEHLDNPRTIDFKEKILNRAELFNYGFLRLSREDRFSIYVQEFYMVPSPEAKEMLNPLIHLIDFDILNDDTTSLPFFAAKRDCHQAVFPSMGLMVKPMPGAEGARTTHEAFAMNPLILNPMVPLITHLWSIQPEKRIHWNYFFTKAGPSCWPWHFCFAGSYVSPFVLPGNLKKHLATIDRGQFQEDLFDNFTNQEDDFKNFEYNEFAIWEERQRIVEHEITEESDQRYLEFGKLYELETDLLEEIIFLVKIRLDYLSNRKYSSEMPIAIEEVQGDHLYLGYYPLNHMIYRIRKLYYDYLVSPDMFPIFYPEIFEEGEDDEISTMREMVSPLLKKNYPWNRMAQEGVLYNQYFVDKGIPTSMPSPSEQNIALESLKALSEQRLLVVDNMETFKQTVIPLISILDTVYVYSNCLGLARKDSANIQAYGILNHLAGMNVIGVGNFVF